MLDRTTITVLAAGVLLSSRCCAFLMPSQRAHALLQSSKPEWTSDFDDFIGDDSYQPQQEQQPKDSKDESNYSQKRGNDNKSLPNYQTESSGEQNTPIPTSNLLVNQGIDRSAIRIRQFLLGPDLILSNYVGNLGFDEVTDWEYYYENMEDPTDRKVVQPNPFDTKNQPRRTRTSSGSVVRIFRGEFAGILGGQLRSQGLDNRLLVKEFTGDLALQLAQAELKAVSKLQSSLVNEKDEQDWFQAASSRSVLARKDHNNVANLQQKLVKQPYLGILGEVDIVDLLEDSTPNDFYRALGVPPPAPNAVWIVYEYAGLSTVQSYCLPAQIRRANIPLKKGFFGKLIEPPALPSWDKRANYVIKGIVKQAITALATLHENGMVHRSIGRNSLILSSKGQDKREAVSPYATDINNLIVKLGDFGFAGPYEGCAKQDEQFCARARTFGLSFDRSDNNIATANFAMAEDMHALGFVVLGLLLTSLAELPTPDTPIPATDEDSLQRLLGDIFDKDVKGRFREYVNDEDIWSNLVQLLDKNDKAGWTVLETLLLAREKAAKNKDTMQIFSVRGLLSNPFFN